jgi:hypothetical protein
MSKCNTHSVLCAITNSNLWRLRSLLAIRPYPCATPQPLSSFCLDFTHTWMPCFTASNVPLSFHTVQTERFLLTMAKTALEIHFTCSGNKEIYCILKTCCINTILQKM